MLQQTDLAIGRLYRGKVRDTYDLGDGRLVLVTTDRLSAFDRVLGCVEHKGQVLNELAAWWFEELSPLVANHLLAVPDPNVSIGRTCQALPVEVVVRGYITGVTSTSLWQQYHEGRRNPYDLHLPEGLRKNDALPAPVVTPTTKAADGAHDEPLSAAQVVERGLVEAGLWAQVLDVAVEVFRRGQARAAAAGLVLVDTKYEFGLDDEGNLTLIDEVHTPDSSRYWDAATLAERRAAGYEPDSADKELVRRWYAALGYRGDGPAPPWPAELAELVSRRYIDVYERLTGRAFVPASEPAEPRIAAAVARYLSASAPRGGHSADDRAS